MKALRNSANAAHLVVGLALTAQIGASQASGAPAAQTVDRTVLPIQFAKPAAITALYARDVKSVPPRQELNAPAGAPNVMIVLIDDLGFGATEVFGGPLKTPTMDRLASGGLRYNSFHTPALCSPTRVALKSGRNHHTGNMGSITEMATGLPGTTGEVPNRVAPLAEMLRLNGYSTAAFGEWHETAVWETSAKVAEGQPPDVSHRPVRRRDLHRGHGYRCNQGDALVDRHRLPSSRTTPRAGPATPAV